MTLVRAFGWALAICAAVSAEAEVYRWTDAQGRVHYSDKKPAAAAEDVTRAVTRQNLDTGTEERRKLEQILRKENPADRAYVQQHTAAAHNQQQRRCAAVRTRIARISRPVRFVDKQGRDVRVTEAQRSAEIDELKLYLARHCD